LLPESVVDKELFKYKIDLIKIENFREFFKSCKDFSPFSKKAFLKSVAIPPGYFSEQPDDTKEDLLVNKEDVVQQKYPGSYVLLVKDGEDILNCARIEFSDFDLGYNRIKSSNEKQFILVKEYIKNGYISTFIKHSDNLVKGGWNKGLFVDIPLICNKDTYVSEGYYYIPAENEDHYKCMYVSTEVLDFTDYQHLDLYVKDFKETSFNDNSLEIAKETPLLKELDEILIYLKDEKVIPSQYIKSVPRYVEKNALPMETVFDLVNVLLSYENGISSFNKAKVLRSCLSHIKRIL
jgi:hypothetical protein